MNINIVKIVYLGANRCRGIIILEGSKHPAVKIAAMPALIERPKMSLAMWAALKTHIMKEREKKKQEQEADAAFKQMQRDQENKRKENAMTLEEINVELSQIEKKRKYLQDEKEENFQIFKRILNEDKKRINQEEKEASSNEIVQANHHYPNQNIPIAASNLYMIAGNRVMNRNAVMYKVGTVPTQQQNGAMKRQRSPSPPTSNYQNYGYKAQHVAPYGQTYPIPHPANQYPTQEQAKHLAASYHVAHIPPGFVGNIPHQIEHPSQKPINMQDEKYYIQAGGISAGYPIRSQPQAPSHFQPPTSHSVTTPIQVPLRKEDVMRRNMSNEGHRQ
ncbi:hypothetical protein JTE90_012883 [Oedothorax gibbosus]|uniref:G protein pathway suppressor 2 n=1 Tax=Oedothorax gibbosus TaxID=931172 RepID=A0AAV6U8V8_9ARAC|nr:hypothetical protein JTE90_012883 [Oedothorax gibbosus]